MSPRETIQYNLESENHKILRLCTTLTPEEPICNSAGDMTWKITSIISRQQHMFSHKKFEGYSGRAPLSTDS